MDKVKRRECHRFAKGHISWLKGTKGLVKPNSGSFKKGLIPWNKGKKGIFVGDKSPSWKGGFPKCLVCGKKLSSYLAKKCWDCFHNSIKGKNHPMYGVHRFGINAPNYKGDKCITPANKRIRMSNETKEWRKLIFLRDNYTCRKCKKVGGNLEAHHKKSWTKYPELRFDINNGITLCLPCHRKMHTKKERLV